MTATMRPDAGAVLRRLAEAEEPCPDSFPFHDESTLLERVSLENCPKCHGTSRVPRFRGPDGEALFRKRCPLCTSGVRHSFSDTYDCYHCRGLGWLPLDVDEVHLEMLLLFAASNERESIAGGQLFWTLLQALETAAREATKQQDFVEAGLLILDAATEARG